jgi:rfaE bifunctional protein nucleotidyltransferase chain/domain
MEVVVFTNGCFDILHPGHIELLKQAKALGTKLIVGINSDNSVKAIKGHSRPVVSENDRAEVLRGLSSVDEVVIFNEPTPQTIIEKLKPNILVKGGDWAVEEIIGADFVKKNGGKVYSIPFRNGYSTSSIIEKIESQNDEIEDRNADFSVVENGLSEHLQLTKKLLDNEVNSIQNCGKIIVEALKLGNNIFLCGNENSTQVAQIIAGELLKRVRKEGNEIKVFTSSEAISNDVGDEKKLFRQLNSKANKGDVLIGISNTGNSSDINSAMIEARQKGCLTIGLTGADGKKIASLCDAAVLIQSTHNLRIQEAHLTIGNLWSEMVETEY